MDSREMMRRAIELSFEGVKTGGGPFGAVVAKDGVIVGEGKNSVVPHSDPTAHAEIVAIRDACRNLDTFDLSGCEIYSSSEPCPMCLAAVWWARIDRIYFANTRTDAKGIGFDDDFFYEQICLPPSQWKIPATQMLGNEAIAAFMEWDKKEDKIPY